LYGGGFKKDLAIRVHDIIADTEDAWLKAKMFFYVANMDIFLPRDSKLQLADMFISELNNLTPESDPVLSCTLIMVSRYYLYQLPEKSRGGFLQ
jgi:hypothetical protein